MPGELAKLSIRFETNVRNYKRDMQQAEKATEQWEQATEKSGQAAQQSAKKSQGAFSKIGRAIRGLRSDASKGADFEVRGKESGFSGLLKRVRGVRDEAGKGATFSVRGQERGLSGLLNRIKGARTEADKGADFKVRGDTSILGKFERGISKIRSSASRGTDFEVRGKERGLSAISSKLRGTRKDADKGATFSVEGKAGGLAALTRKMGGVRSEASRGATFEVDTGSSESNLNAVKDSLSSIGETAAGVAGGMALEDVGSGLAENFQEAGRAVGGFEGRLGASKSQATDLAGVGKEVFAGAWGGSLAEVNQAVTTVAQGLGTMDDAAKTQKLTEQAMTLSDAFGMDVTESVEAARLMSQNFGISSERAFDLVAAGARDGANTSGDLLDSLREYSPMFSRLGISGSEAMRMFAEGADAGIWNTDRLGDAVKEFSVRAVDGSETTKKGFKMAGLSAQEMSAKIAKGGPTAEKAFQRTVSSILSIQDPAKRAQAGVALFGTLYEDIGDKGLRAMQKGAQGMGKVDGAAKQTGDSLYNNFTTRLQGATRQIQVMISDSGLGAAGSAFGGLAETAGFAGMAVMGLGPAASKAGPALAGAAGKARALAGGATAAKVGLASIVWPVAVAGALAGAFFLAYNRSEKFKQGVDNLNQKLTGSKNIAKITKDGWKGLGNVASDNRGISILWAEDLGKVKRQMQGNSEAATPFNKAMVRIGTQLRDNKGVSWLWNKGLGKLWQKMRDGQGPLSGFRKTVDQAGEDLRDTKGASGEFRRQLGFLGKKLTDNEGLSGAFRNAIKTLGDRMTDTKNTSTGFNKGMKTVGKNLTDTKGASGGVRKALGWLGDKFGQTKKRSVTETGKMKTNVSGKWGQMEKDSDKKFSGVRNWITRRLREGKERGAKNNKALSGSLAKQWRGSETDSNKRFSGIRDWIGQRTREGDKRGSKNIRQLGSNMLDRWKRDEKNSNTRFSGIRDWIGQRTREGDKRGSKNMRSLGSFMLGRWNKDQKNSNNKFSNIRDWIGQRTREAKKRGSTNIRQLGKNLGNIWGNIRKGARNFGDAFAEILRSRFQRGINKARKFLGSLMGAIGSVLNMLGKKGIGGRMKDAEKRMKTPVKFARGGIAKKDRGGVLDSPVQVGGEAGEEGLMPLTRWTPGGQKAYDAGTPLYGKGRGPGGNRPQIGTGPPRNLSEASRSGGGYKGSGGTTNWVPWVGKIARAVTNYLGGNVMANTYPNHGGRGLWGEQHSFDLWRGYRGGPIGHSTGQKAVDYMLSRHKKDLLYYIWAGKIHGWGRSRPYSGYGGSHHDHPHFTMDKGKNLGGAKGGGGGFFDVLGKARRLWKKYAPKPPSIGLGLLGAGFKGFGKDLLGYAWDFIKSKLPLGGSGGNGDTVFTHFNDFQTASGRRGNNTVASSVIPLGSLLDITIGGKTLRGSVDDLGPNSFVYERHHPKAVLDLATSFMNRFPAGGDLVHGSFKVAKKGKGRTLFGYTRWDGTMNPSLGSRGYQRGGIIPGVKGEKVFVQAHAGERVLSERNNAAFERLANSIEIWSAKAGGSGSRGPRSAPLSGLGSLVSSGEPEATAQAVRDEMAELRRENRRIAEESAEKAVRMAAALMRSDYGVWATDENVYEAATAEQRRKRGG
ncbi:MAG: phage tail tape measure protein [Rubrobacteraceae bacterium]